MYKLFYFPRNASWAPHMLLEEIGVDFQLELVDRKSQQQKSADYLKLNPTGRIPTFVDGEQIIQESAAICIHLAEKYPDANWIPKADNPERVAFFQWMFYLTTSIQSELMLYFYPDKHLPNTEMAKTVSEIQQRRVTEMFAHVDASLSGKSYLVGEQLTVCDLFLFMLSHWASGFERAPLTFPHLGAYLRKLAKRPAIQKVADVEGTDLSVYR